jgi:hypothetical protein
VNGTSQRFESRQFGAGRCWVRRAGSLREVAGVGTGQRVGRRVGCWSGRRWVLRTRTPNKLTGANRRPAFPFRGGVAVPERVVSAGVAVGRLSLSSGR